MQNTKSFTCDQRADGKKITPAQTSHNQRSILDGHIKVTSAEFQSRIQSLKGKCDMFVCGVVILSDDNFSLIG